MKKIIYAFAFMALSISVISCSKDEVSSVTPAVTNGVFTWTADNGATIITADSAYFDTRYKTIKAYKGGMAQFVEINLSADTVGTYPLGSINAVSYLYGSSVYVANAGAVNISAKSSTKTTGVFSSTSTSGGFTTFSGTFTNIDIR